MEKTETYYYLLHKRKKGIGQVQNWRPRKLQNVTFFNHFFRNIFKVQTYLEHVSYLYQPKLNMHLSTQVNNENDRKFLG